MDQETTPSQARLILWMALFVLLGIPLVAVLWETLNHLLALQTDAGLILAIPAAVLLFVMLYLLSRTLIRNRFRGSSGTSSSP